MQNINCDTSHRFFFPPFTVAALCSSEFRAVAVRVDFTQPRESNRSTQARNPVRVEEPRAGPAALSHPAAETVASA